MDKIELKLGRDQTRLVQEKWFSYINMMYIIKVKDAKIANNEVLYIATLVIQALIDEIFESFTSALNSTKGQFTFKYSKPQALVYYKVLIDLPLLSTEKYEMDLHELICDTLFTQLQDEKFLSK